KRKRKSSSNGFEPDRLSGTKPAIYSILKTHGSLRKVYGVDATHNNSVSNPKKAKQLAFS
ncbi:hypothetical protein KKE54_08735, partial [bacterium]|nr:hypothetical protein [bacterium]